MNEEPHPFPEAVEAIEAASHQTVRQERLSAVAAAAVPSDDPYFEAQAENIWRDHRPDGSKASDFDGLPDNEKALWRYNAISGRLKGY